MRTQEPLALILADIDPYKKYNDTYGHAAGDECLRRIARVMQKLGRRTSDLAARYGGEELALILPVTNLSDANAGRGITQSCGCIANPSSNLGG